MDSQYHSSSNQTMNSCKECKFKYNVLIYQNALMGAFFHIDDYGFSVWLGDSSPETVIEYGYEKIRINHPLYFNKDNYQQQLEKIKNYFVLI